MVFYPIKGIEVIMKRKLLVKAGDCFTHKEELANTVIHAAGLLFGLVAIPILVMLASQENNLSDVMRVGIYGVCFLATFTFSTLFHGFKNEKIKCRLEKCDRISIYFFIAGAYTPFVLYYMYNSTGIILLSIIWGLVFLGFLFELFLANRYTILSVFVYLAMGFMFLFVLNKFFETMPSYVIGLILAGVGLYSVGIIFYIWKKWQYHHAVWHLFVLGASICHYIAVLETVA